MHVFGEYSSETLNVSSHADWSVGQSESVLPGQSPTVVVHTTWIPSQWGWVQGQHYWGEYRHILFNWMYIVVSLAFRDDFCHFTCSGLYCNLAIELYSKLGHFGYLCSMAIYVVVYTELGPFRLQTNTLASILHFTLPWRTNYIYMHNIHTHACIHS